MRYIPSIPNMSGHKRRRLNCSSSSLNPKPSKRAKIPQLIHDDDDDDDYKDTFHQNKNTTDETVIDTSNNHGFQFNSPQSARTQSAKRRKRSDKEEMDDDSNDDDKCNENAAFRTPIKSARNRSYISWTTSSNRTATRRTNEQIAKYQKRLKEYTQIERILERDYDRSSMDELQLISEHKAHILNKIDILHAVNDGKRWYPMMHYSPSTKRYKPDVHRFKPKEYEIYREKLNAQIISHRVADEMKDAQRIRALFENTNEKMWKHLLRQCGNIQKCIARDGMFYHQGIYHQDGKIWWFKNEKRREQYANSIMDLLNWYNTHTNNTYHDGKFGTVLLKRCDEKNGDFSYVAEFKRVTIEQYEAYRKEFKKEMSEYCAKGETKTMYNRVVPMRFKNKKRKISDISPQSSKRRRISRETSDNSVVYETNCIINDGNGTKYTNFKTKR